MKFWSSKELKSTNLCYYILKKNRIEILIIFCKRKKILTELHISAHLILLFSCVQIKRFSNVHTCRCFEPKQLFLSKNH